MAWALALDFYMALLLDLLFYFWACLPLDFSSVSDSELVDTST